MEEIIRQIDQEIQTQETLKQQAWKCNDYSTYNEVCAFISGLSRARQLIREYANETGR